MSSLVARIQRALLTGENDEEYVRGLLRELQIPANQPPDPDCLRKVRRVVLYSGASEQEMRDAFASVGLTGIGPNDVAVRDLLAEAGSGETPTA